MLYQYLLFDIDLFLIDYATTFVQTFPPFPPST